MKLTVVALLAILIQCAQPQSEATVSYCGHPGNITNGKVILDNGTKIDSTVYYKCDEGYRLNGWSYRTCGRYGWNEREPSCVLDCGHPGNITNGTAEVHEYPYGKSIFYSCDVGYILKGLSWRTCQSNGTWSGNQPTCEAIKRCPNPEDIDHGSVTVADRIRYIRQLYVSYSCDRGYALRGQSRRNCDLSTGEWEGPAPTCEESNVDCGHPGNIQYGTVDVSEGTKLHASIHYTCDRGYILTGPSSRTCKSYEAWSGREPTCEDLKRCSNPEDIDHGSVRVVDGIRLIRQLSAWYSCDRGHALRGQRIRDCDLLTGEWEGPAPTCEESSVDCGHPENVTNGTVDVTIPHATAWYMCDEGFMLNGTRYRTCGSNGRWSGTTPTCEVSKTCPQPNIGHGSVEVAWFFTVYYATYTCDVGYELRGISYRVCDLLAEEWDGTAPTCEESNVDCGHPGNITNGTVNVSGGTELDATVQYSCDEGFSRSGSSTRTCQSDGRWSGTNPICEAIDCGHPGGITNGRVDVSRGTKLGDKVHYSCKRGYKLKGPSTRKCKKTGRWNKRAPTCKKGN